MSRLHAPLATALLALLTAGPALAGGSLERYVLTDEPSPYPGEVIVRTAPILQDARCLPIPYSMNVTLDPIPNPRGDDFLSLAEAKAAITRSMDRWNDIPTSFIEMRFLDTSDSLVPAAFDTVNEITFRALPGFGGVAGVSPSVSLFADTFLAGGTDLDGDGDSDVAAGLATCADVDGDGDWERPEGLYAAGTILDNDVWFNPGYWTFVTDLDPGLYTFDLEALATHELGHSHGLAHAMTNQVSPTDAGRSVMHPSPDWTDPLDLADQRSPSAEDVAYSSYLYPEGSAADGPAALQAGDVAFDAAYGILAGEVSHGAFGVPLPGASVSAVHRETGAVAVASYAGAIVLSFDPATGGARFLPGAGTLEHGRFELPVPAGTYEVRVEAVDFDPVSPYGVNTTTAVSANFGLQSFDEEAWHRGLEGAVEVAPGRATPVEVAAGETVSGLDLVTNRTRRIGPGGGLSAFTSALAAPGTYYAVRVPATEVLALAGGERFALPSAEYYTSGPTYSTVPIFARALLTTGEALADGTARIDLETPLAGTTGFVGQEFDFAPLYFANPVALGERVENGVANGSIDDLFLVLQVPTERPFPGPYDRAPGLGIDRYFGPGDTPVQGRSYVSTDGGATFTPLLDGDYLMALVLSELP